MPDLPLCLGVPVGHGEGGDIFLPHEKRFTIDFCLCDAILNLKAFCFGAIPDVMIELTAWVGLPDIPPPGPN